MPKIFKKTEKDLLKTPDAKKEIKHLENVFRTMNQNFRKFMKEI